MLGIIIFGVMSYTSLAASDLPNIDFSMIQLHGGLPRASPEKMASTVATQMEHQLTTIEGPGGDEFNQHDRVHEHHAAILNGPLPSDRDLGRADATAAEHAESSHAAKREPGGPADLDSDFLFSHTAVDAYAENIVAQRISALDGVAQITAYGPQKYAVRLQLDPSVLAARHPALMKSPTDWNDTTRICRQAHCGDRIGLTPCRPMGS
jgi:HAE1 family hydrophobic/amphiphilic exporter-1